MAHFAVIENNQVINIILADVRETAEAVTERLCVQFDPEVNDVKIGDIFEPEADASAIK